MRPLPQIPEWVLLEHEVAHILSKQERHGWHFNERAAWQLASSLEQELQDLKRYFARDTLTSQELNSLQSEITKLAATSKVQPLLD